MEERERLSLAGEVLTKEQLSLKRRFYLFGSSGRGLAGSSAFYLDSDTAMGVDNKNKLLFPV